MNTINNTKGVIVKCRSSTVTMTLTGTGPGQGPVWTEAVQTEAEQIGALETEVSETEALQTEAEVQLEVEEADVGRVGRYLNRTIHRTAPGHRSNTTRTRLHRVSTSCTSRGWRRRRLVRFHL